MYIFFLKYVLIHTHTHAPHNHLKYPEHLRTVSFGSLLTITYAFGIVAHFIYILVPLVLKNPGLATVVGHIKGPCD